MKVKIEYVDSSNLSDKEILSQMHSIFGDSVHIETSPNNNTPRACIKYGIEKLLTEDQALLYFDYPELQYKKKIQEKVKELNAYFNSIISEVIRDNENRWT